MQRLLTKPWLAAIATALIATVWLVAAARQPGGNDPASPDSGAASHLLAVRSAVARTEDWPATLEVFGNLAPWDEIIVGAQVEGQPLVELRANVGDRVRRGQILARFDTDKLRAEVLRLKAEFEQARAEAAQAESDRDRALALANSGAISKQEISSRVTGAQVAAARVGAARAQLATRELDLQRAVVVAPDDGTVSARSAQSGMVGSPGLELFRIIRRDRLEWRGELTAAQIARAEAGQEVLLSLPDGSQSRARVRHVAPAMNAQTRLATLYADVEPGSSARPGTYVNGRIVLGDSPALVVPASAVVVRDGYGYAFLVTSDGERHQVKRQRVEVGRRIGAAVEVLAGLEIGQRVVAEGAGFLDDGDAVRLVTTQASR